MENKKTSVAVGLFDGVHKGHKAVIENAVDFARKNNISSAVFTFKNDSLKISEEKILTEEQKTNFLKKLSVDEILSVDFSDVKNLSPKEFVTEILIGKLGAVNISCGGDFRFGKDAVGNAVSLSEIAKSYGISVEIIDEVLYHNDRKISSSEIRELIKSGDIKTANEMLGYNFKIENFVEFGNRIGRTINFPTVNQKFSFGQIIPKFGVYISKVKFNGESFAGVTNIGVKPTVSDVKIPLAETHIIGFNGDIYGEKISVELVDFIRAEKKFESLEELKLQIKKDVSHVYKI